MKEIKPQILHDMGVRILIPTGMNEWKCSIQSESHRGTHSAKSSTTK